MFILAKIQSTILISPQQYTHGHSKSIKNAVFSKYLFKIVANIGGICVKVKSIEVRDNVILRKTADMRVELLLQLIVLKIYEDQYIQGQVVQQNQDQGLIISFSGVLEGKISPQCLHQGSLFNGSNWIFPYSQNTAFLWKIGSKVRAKVYKTNWQNQNAKSMSQLISLRANQEGLGPQQWWI